MITTRAKMKATTVNRSYVKLECIYDSTDTEEDNSFSEATPSGNMELHVTNPAALELFKEGKYYFVDISAVPVK